MVLLLLGRRRLLRQYRRLLLGWLRLLLVHSVMGAGCPGGSSVLTAPLLLWVLRLPVPLAPEEGVALPPVWEAVRCDCESVHQNASLIAKVCINTRLS